MNKAIRAARVCNAFISKLNIMFGIIGGVITFIYSLLIVSNIARRLFFNKPISGTLEIGEIVLVTVIFFNLAHAQMKDAHIRVRAFFILLDAKWQDRIETVILAVGFFMMAFMAWISFPFAMESFLMKEQHMSVDIPIWPSKLILFLGWLMLSVQFLIEFLKKIIPEKDIKKEPLGETL